MMLYEHQQKYAHGYKDRELVVHETGTGKSVCAAVWLKDGRDSDALVICPKRIKDKWKKELDKWGTQATILSNEEHKKTDHKKWSAIVVDEADYYASPLFVAKQRSKRTEHLYELMRHNEDTPRLLMSATPIRSSPWNLHTLLVLKGEYYNWKKWREQYFKLEQRPFLPGMAWFPKPGWRRAVSQVLKQHADIVLMKDITDLPSEHTEEVSVTAPSFTPSEWEPAKRFYEEHRYEQKNKVKHIKDIARGYRKVMVVAYYREQCEELYKELSKERQTYLVYGGTKEQEATATQANQDDECYLIVQASLGAGFDADTFPVVVFASLSYAVASYIQMKGRVRRIHNLHPVTYYHLLAGRCDEAVWRSVQQGFDFIPSQWS